MPTRARRICPRCRQPSPVGQRCPTCTSRTSTPTSFRYDTADWKARRTAYLATHPQCAICAGVATVPDHFPISRRDLIRLGALDVDDETRLRPLCAPCHAGVTPYTQPGGFNTDRE